MGIFNATYNLIFHITDVDFISTIVGMWMTAAFYIGGAGIFFGFVCGWVFDGKDVAFTVLKIAGTIWILFVLFLLVGVPILTKVFIALGHINWSAL